MPRYSVSFFCKEKILSVQQSHELSTILQVDYLQITQQSQTIYIPYNDSLQEHTLQIGIFPTKYPTSTSLSKSAPKKIQNDIKALTDMTGKHHYDMKTTNENITAMLQNLTDTNFTTEKHK